MLFDTLIDIATLHDHLAAKNWVIVDCRYDMSDTAYGRRAWLEAHIPGAVYADLHDDLSGPPVTDHGRHPLPGPERLNETLQRLGISSHSQVVVYDHLQGSFAGRLWWLLRYMGHAAVAVLDGGWPSWLQAGLATRSGEESSPRGNFHGFPRSGWLVTVDQVPEARLLIDSRDPARDRGEVEPLDQAAGHIPGALNRFWKNNLDERGCFRSREALRRELLALLGKVAPDESVFYCGSGVTACHNLLAAAHAGLPAPKLYAGSWSDWCSSPDRPVATGDEPGKF
jgi:thiosulfate/3-mercaptopyruvate sulfurtransferase